MAKQPDDECDVGPKLLQMTCEIDLYVEIDVFAIYF